MTTIPISKAAVPFFNYPAVFLAQEEEMLAEIRRVLVSGKLILQEDVVRFETNFAAFLGVKHAISVANGTDSIMFGLMASGVVEGAEVILPSHTFVATASAVHYAGATPVLVDCRDDHMIDPAAVEKAITPRTRAIVPVQLNGRTAEMDTILDIAKRHSLVVIEDAAQALGSRFRGQMAGTFGAASSFSFYPAKILGCFGDGGAVVTNSDDMATALRSLRDHGRMDDGDVRGWSFNSRLDNLQAAVLDLKLRTLPDALERRRAIAALYHSLLGGIPELRLPPAPGADPRHHDVFQNFEIEAERRDELQVALRSSGIGTIIQWGGRAVHQFSRLGFKVNLPVTERVMARGLLLPLHTALSDDDVHTVAQAIRAFYGAGSE